MAREYSNKVTLRPAPGTVPAPGVSPIDVIVVSSDPNGAISANAGSLALLAGGIASWRCTGGFTWVQLPDPPSAWFPTPLVPGWFPAAGWYPPAFRLTGTGDVELRGAAFGPPFGGILFTLPLGFRPAFDVGEVGLELPFPPGPTVAWPVTVFSTGLVIPDVGPGAGSVITLDGIIFSTLP